MSDLSEEDFSRFQNQLLELREKNYSLEDKLKKQSKELDNLNETCNKQSAIIRTSKKANEAENLSRDNNLLRSRLKNQEEDFKLQNDTLLQELNRLVNENESLEKSMKELCEGLSSDTSNDPSTDDSKQAAMLKAELALFQKKYTKECKDYTDQISVLDSKISQLSSQNLDLQKLLSQHSIIQEEGSISLKEGGVRFKKLSLSEESHSSDVGKEQQFDELNKQLNSLKEKAAENEARVIVANEKSKQELEDIKQKHSKEMEAMKGQYESISQRYNETEAKLTETSERAQQLMAQIVQSKQEINSSRSELSAIKETLSDQTQEMNELSNQLSDSLAIREQKEEQLQQFGRQNQQLTDQLKKSDDANESLKKKNEELQKTLQDKRILIDEMKKHLEDVEKNHAIKMKEITLEKETEKAQFESTNRGHISKIASMEEDLSSLNTLKKKVEKLENEKKMVEERIVQVEEDLSTHKEYWQVEKEKIESEAELIMHDMETRLTEESNSLKTELEIAKIQKQEVDDKVMVMEKQLSDASEERVIQEKRGLAMLKDMKKQLSSERRRADKLQEKMRQLLNDPNVMVTGQTTEIDDDVSSVSSWSMVSEDQRQNDGVMTQSPTKSNRSSVSVSSETTELLQRVASLQENNWQLEEKIQHLESSAASMAQDILNKSLIIEHHCLRANSAVITSHSALQSPSHSPHSPVRSASTPTGGGVRRLMSRIKEVGEEVAHNIASPTAQETERENNRRLQAMLEETLLKNINLHKDIDVLSEQVKTLTKLLSEEKTRE